MYLPTNGSSRIVCSKKGSSLFFPFFALHMGIALGNPFLFFLVLNLDLCAPDGVPILFFFKWD
jgi:hypothetical protein